MIHHRDTEDTEKKQKTLCLCGENWFLMAGLLVGFFCVFDQF